jgi:hypothetical protein
MSEESNSPPPVFQPVAPAPPKAPKPTGKTSIRTKADAVVTDIVTGVKTMTETIVEKVLDSQPVKVTLAAPHAFYDEAGKLFSWAAGQVVEDADEVKLLIERGALILEE